MRSLQFATTLLFVFHLLIPSAVLSLHVPIQTSNSDTPMLVVNRREGLLKAGQMMVAMIGGSSMGTLVQPAFASQGAEAKIEMPNVLQGFQDRATKQCLVESLGNRECLVYAGDDQSRLYQGLNNQVLLDRIESASRALANVPPLIEGKKWSQATGILTGPMGELLRTMIQLVEISENKATAKAQVQKFKTDLYALSAAIDRRQGSVALQYHQAATDDLVAFVKAL